LSAAAQLRDYQQDGVHWIVRQFRDHKAVLLADEAGLGKTLEALTAAQKLAAENILIVCPAGARRVWLQEIERWVPDWLPRVILAEPGTNLSELQTRLSAGSEPMILILGYDELSKGRNPFIACLHRHWDLLVLDEAHYLKNPSNRTQAVYGSRGSAEGIHAAAAKVLLLTGTPTPNHAGELWQHYRALWPDALGKPLTLTQFEERFTRYKDTVFGRQVVGSKNQAVLREALGPMVLRRRKDEVLAELPPLILQDVPLSPVSLADRGLSFDARMAESLLSWADIDEELLKGLRQPEVQIATLRRELGEAKVKPTILWVQERLQSTHKILLFAWHHSVIAHLAKGLTEFNPVVITGETSPKARAEGIYAFQHDSWKRVFIGQVLAAGTAITLTAANEVAIVEPSWVPGENVQAICRAHRLGQRDSVLASFLYLPGTLDKRIMQVFRRKAGEIAELQGEGEWKVAESA